MRRRASGHFRLPIPAAEAIGFFTPEGERNWVHGWDPKYPDGDPTEIPGTVFITEHGDMRTFWVIEEIDRVASRAAYSRITPGHHAGSVRVRCVDRPDSECTVSVEYDMTALSPDNPRVLDAYGEEPFKAMLKEWASGVTETLPN